MNEDKQLLEEFVDGERKRLTAIELLQNLPEVLQDVSEVVDDIYKQRIAFMSLLIKLLCDTGMYTITFNVKDLSYYENYSVKVTGNEDDITLEVIFPNSETPQSA